MNHPRPRPAGAGPSGPSLRVRVALAAAGTTAVLAVVAAGVLGAVLSGRETARQDTRLAVVAGAVAGQVGAAGPAAAADLGRAADPRAALGRLVPGLVVTVDRAGTVVAAAGSAAAWPAVPVGRHDVTVAGVRYRAVTVAATGTAVTTPTTVTAAEPAAATRAQVRRIRLLALALGVAATAVAAALGWLAAGRAVRPLQALAARTRGLHGRPEEAASLAASPVSATPETADLARALADLLGRVGAARADTERALAEARAFAASAGHELRTPLTALRTDLEVLAAHPDLPDAERAEVVEGLRRTEARVEATLSALAALAGGTLTDPARFVPVDLADVVSRAVADLRTGAGVPPVDVHLPRAEVVVTGSPGGLRSVVDNLLTNAVRHARASRITVAVDLTAPPPPGGGRPAVRLTVDDDGVGIPPGEREAVFGRFVRGRGGAPGGSGLGLALVAAQVHAHGGRVRLTDPPGPAGAAGRPAPPGAGPRGTRAEVVLPGAPDRDV